MHFFRHFHQRLHSHMHDHHGGSHHHARGHKTFDAGALRYIVLQLIADQPRHGYEIIKEIEQRVGGGYSPSPGVIYPLLSMLEDLGHVVVTPDGNKKLHAITPEGRAFLDDNREFVDVLSARMQGRGASRGGHGGIRSTFHELKATVMERARGESSSDERVEKIRQILAEATTQIRKLA